MALLQKGYLGATPLFRDVRWYEPYTPNRITAGSNVTVTADTAAHTKGGWSALIASTSANASLLIVVVSGVNTTNTDTSTLIDFATGASGSETPFAENICVGGNQGNSIAIPLQIPSGTRISARIQSVVTGGKTATVSAAVFNYGDYANAPTSVDVINAGDPLTSKGTEFTGASGTFSLANASTSQAYRAVSMAFAVQTNNSAALPSSAYNKFELGVGAAGSEVAEGEVSFTTAVNENTQNGGSFSLIGRNIPSGSRVTLKHPIAANPERYGFCLIGIP
jgi:hypothetical protein